MINSSLWKLLQSPPRIGKRDVILTLLPGVLWTLAVYSRPYVITPRCVTNPETCTVESVPWPDRLLFRVEDGVSDERSFTTQYLSGAVALGVASSLQIAAVVGRGVSPWTAIAGITTDFVILLQTTAWNGVITESTRLLVQRPRPFVFFRSEEHGASAANYTSFFSGHTSFSSTMCFSLLLILLGRRARWPWLAASGLVSGTLVVLTGTFRVLAGRHFVTDVIAGTIGGAVVAVAVALTHRRRPRDPSRRG